MKPLLFVHIPKTAGTSFRKAYSSLIPAHKTYCDYGEESVETSPVIQKWIIEKGDFLAFKKRGFNSLVQQVDQCKKNT